MRAALTRSALGGDMHEDPFHPTETGIFAPHEPEPVIGHEPVTPVDHEINGSPVTEFAGDPLPEERGSFATEPARESVDGEGAVLNEPATIEAQREPGPGLGSGVQREPAPLDNFANPFGTHQGIVPEAAPKFRSPGEDPSIHPDLAEQFSEATSEERT